LASIASDAIILGERFRCGSVEDYMVEEGGKAPDFALLDDQGNSLRLSDFSGKKTVVLFFYPKANTPG
jgi:peroxiredoxin Q/BCP